MQDIETSAEQIYYTDLDNSDSRTKIRRCLNSLGYDFASLMYSLSQLGPISRPLAEELISYIEDTGRPTETKQEYIEGLTLLGDSVEQAFKARLSAFKMSSISVSFYYLEARGCDAQHFSESLLPYTTQRECIRTAARACATLAIINHKYTDQSIGTLVDAIREDNRTSDCIEALNLIGPPAERCVSEIMSLYGGNIPDEVRLQIYRLGKEGESECLKVLKEGPDHRQALAIEALAYGPAPSLEVLVALIESLDDRRLAPWGAPRLWTTAIYSLDKLVSHFTGLSQPRSTAPWSKRKAYIVDSIRRSTNELKAFSLWDNRLQEASDIEKGLAMTGIGLEIHARVTSSGHSFKSPVDCPTPATSHRLVLKETLNEQAVYAALSDCNQLRRIANWPLLLSFWPDNAVANLRAIIRDVRENSSRRQNAAHIVSAYNRLLEKELGSYQDSNNFPVAIDAMRHASDLWLLREVVRYYDCGFKSFREISGHLSKEIEDPMQNLNIPVSVAEITRAMKRATVFFSQVFESPNIKLFSSSPGFPSMPTSEGRRAAEWSNVFLQRHGYER